MSVARQFAHKLFGADSIFGRRTAGGIYPAAHKSHSLRSRIMATPIPEQLSIPVGTETGSSVTLLVNPGDSALKYQKLAVLEFAGRERSSVAVHAPTSGVVDSLGTSVVADHSQQQQFCIGLTTDGRDEALQLSPLEDYSHLSSADLISLIREAGIIGMGGAGFPTADKLNSCDESSTEFLIINAAECEPYISADEALLRERAEKVVEGADILKRASGASRLIIAIEDNKSDAIAALRKALESDASFEIVLLPSKYPAGSERHLIHCVTGREIPAALHPTAAGIIVQNVGTAYACYEAIVEGKPCISRITTLCGKALKTPKNFEALIGSSADFLFQLCGIELEAKHRSILGGTLMGCELESDKAAVCKTTNCLIAASSEELHPYETERACIRCGFCADACPSKLLPQQLLAFSRTADSTRLLEYGLSDCIECGACDYVCPSHIPLVSSFKKSKQDMESRADSLRHSEYWQQRFQFRQYRIKKEKDQAQTPKPVPSITPEQEKEPAANAASGETETISKEQASRDIAAAVARVKARRDEQKK